MILLTHAFISGTHSIMHQVIRLMKLLIFRLLLVFTVVLDSRKLYLSAVRSWAQLISYSFFLFLLVVAGSGETQHYSKCAGCKYK